MKTLIVTADDFGLSIPVNEAVEKGHTQGILTAASLMVASPGAADAVERARRLPTLGVGLHIVLVGGVPTLPPAEIPDLVGPDGRFTVNVMRKGVAIFCLPHVRRQMEAEVRAQFEAFRRTDLPLDHVNGHHHFHMHPSVVTTILTLAKEYGVPAVRIPHEPLSPSWRAQRRKAFTRTFNWLFHLRRTASMRRQFQAAGIAVNDHIFGLSDSGRMTEDTVLAFLRHLPDGVSELYCHPALSRWSGPDNLPDTYWCEEEAAAMASRQALALVKELNIRLCSFAALGI